MNQDVFVGLAKILPSCVCYDDISLCGCDNVERVIRSYAGMSLDESRTAQDASHVKLPAMNAEQREALLQEIEKVEGHRRADYENVSDKDLANATLSAWRDYCRDKGLI